MAYARLIVRSSASAATPRISNGPRTSAILEPAQAFVEFQAMLADARDVLRIQYRPERSDPLLEQRSIVETLFVEPLGAREHGDVLLLVARMDLQLGQPREPRPDLLAIQDARVLLQHHFVGLAGRRHTG